MIVTIAQVMGMRDEQLAQLERQNKSQFMSVKRCERELEELKNWLEIERV